MINYWDSCILIYGEEFSGYFSFYVKASVKNGYFSYNIISYDGYAIHPHNGSEYILTQFKLKDEEEHGKAIGSKYYEYYTLRYYIPKHMLSPYFVFSIPSFKGDYIEIQIDTSGISIWGIIGIIVAAIVIIVLIIYLIRYYKKRKMINAHQQNQANHPNQPINAPLIPQDENSDRPIEPNHSIN